MTIEDRLLRLERSNRNLKALTFSITLSLGAAVLCGQMAKEKIPEIISAKAFHVLSPDGKVVIDLHFADRLSPGGALKLNDSNGDPVVILSTAENGGSVGVFSGKSAFPAVRLSLDQHACGVVSTANSEFKKLVELGTIGGDGCVGVFDGEERHIALIGPAASGGGAMGVMNNAGKLVASLQSMNGETMKGFGAAAFFDQTGENRIKLGLNSKGSGVVQIINDAGKNSLLLGADDDQQGRMIFYDSNEKQRAVIGCGIGLFDQMEKPVAFVGQGDDGTGLIAVCDPKTETIEAALNSTGLHLRNDEEHE